MNRFILVIGLSLLCATSFFATNKIIQHSKLKITPASPATIREDASIQKPANLIPLKVSSTTNSSDTNVYWNLNCSWGGNTNLSSLKLGFGTNLNAWVYSIPVSSSSNSFSFTLTNSPYLDVTTFWWMTASNQFGQSLISSWLFTPPYPPNMMTLSWTNNIAGTVSIYSKTNLNQPSWTLFASGITTESYSSNMPYYSQYFRLEGTNNNTKGIIISIADYNPANTNSFKQ